jgi:hypothetical protein
VEGKESGGLTVDVGGEDCERDMEIFEENRVLGARAWDLK